MAGKNSVFKAGDVLFKQGDPADSMYLVRKGLLSVYISQDGGTLPLATLDPGSIVGEMAFFDQKPRSASVKAQEDTEVTCITKDDFDKLLKQVPKWMVTMMQSLSGRLRSTNDRLQKLEEEALRAAGGPVLPGQRFPFQIVQRTLRSINISFVKDGEKEGREHFVPMDSVLSLWKEIVGEEQDLFYKIFKVLQGLELVGLKKNAMKQDVLVLLNRGVFLQFADFLSAIAPNFPKSDPFLSDASIALFKAMVEHTTTCGYEALNVNINELAAQNKASGVDTSQWGGGIAGLVKTLDLKVSKNGSAVLMKVNLKEHKAALRYLQFMAKFKQEKLV